MEVKMAICNKCKSNYDSIKEKVCKHCYQLDILKGQCLNLAGIILTKIGDPKENPKFINSLFDLAKVIFEEGKKQKFLEW